MKVLLEQVRKYFAEHEVSFENLTNFLLNYDFSDLEYQDLVPAPEENDYSRNILLLDPLEVVLLYWPPHIESAIHHHEGFYGHVLVLEGTLSNIDYYHENSELSEHGIIDASSGGILPEAEGIIHKLTNRHDVPAVSLHFYYPALENFDGMTIFDDTNKRLGVLNQDAAVASWQSPPEHFHKIVENAFAVRSATQNTKSHRIHPLIPKPGKAEIIRNIREYYREQAEQYDSFDLQHASRKLYIDKINSLVSDQISSTQPDAVLHLACGTGRRAQEIKDNTGLTYKSYGVDVSAAMIAQAEQYDMTCSVGDILDIDFEDNSFDCITMLYAFGHITSHQDRINTLKRVRRWLKPGGFFMFDVFNLHNKNEWGPSALKTFNQLHLDKFGYEKGDVFYTKTGGKEVAFLHYFEHSEIEDLLEEAGMKTAKLLNVGYAVNSGEIVRDENEGSFFIIAEKKA